MTHWYRFLLFYLWIAPHLLLAAVAVLLWNRRLHTTYPAFVLYVWYEITGFVVLFTISVAGLNQGIWYTRVFMVTLVLSAALRFGVIQETFRNVFRGQGEVNTLANSLLWWASGLLFAGVVVFSVFASEHTSNSLIAGAAWVARGVAVIQCGLVLFLLLFSGLLGLSLHKYVFGIALGFGILSSVELANSALRVGDLSESTSKVLNLLPTGGYHIAVLIWLAYLIAPMRDIVQPRELHVGELHHWNTELERFLQ